MEEQGVHLQSGDVRAFVTCLGGMVGPSAFRIGERWVEPMSMAPWIEEPEAAGLPPILRMLRGDFFCLPFGKGEPLHGETANHAWQVIEREARRVKMLLKLTNGGEVEKEVVLEGATIRQVHRLSGIGLTSFGMHAMLHAKTIGLLSCSSITRAQVYPGVFEDPAEGGRTSLLPGANFQTLSEVPLARGGVTDLSTWPSREGFEDLVQVFQDPEEPFSWWAMAYPEEGYAWVQIKDPGVLTGTVLWMSNGGRDYAPWSGRHRGVIGIEEVTSSFHDGLEASLQAQAEGQPTALHADGLEIEVVWGVAPIPLGFGRVEAVERVAEGYRLRSGDFDALMPGQGG